MADLEFILSRLNDSKSMPADMGSVLEEFIAHLDDAYAKGTPEVEDSIYDYLKDCLQRLNPNSPLLMQTYEETSMQSSPQEGYFDAVGEWGNLLDEHPMMSIQTIKSYRDDEFWNFINCLPENGDNLFCSYKINGHGIRVVYNDGELVSATSRARRGRGKDITAKVKRAIGGHNASLEGFGEVEIRGELCLPLANLNMARQYNPDIKSAFSAVSSLLGDGAEDYVELLDLLAYNVYTEDGLSFDYKSEEYDWLESHGFSVPGNVTAEFTSDDLSSPGSAVAAVQEVMKYFEDGYDAFGYFCDGVVIQVDSNEEFAELGDDGVRNNGNIAMKVGLWKQEGYVGRVNRIEWTRGTSKMSPVAILESLDGDERGVLVAQGNRVRRVPLYEPANILYLGARPGNMLHFNYGGESAVVPTNEAGEPLKESSAEERLEEWLASN